MPVRHVLLIHVECVIHRRRRWGIVWRSRLFEKEWVEVLDKIRQRLCGGSHEMNVQMNVRISERMSTRWAE